MKTEEPYRAETVREFEELGPVILGPWSSWCYRHNPRYLLFALSRYKFVGKMMKGVGAERVLEVGCGDGFGIPLVEYEGVGKVVGVDYEPYVVEHPVRLTVKVYGEDPFRILPIDNVDVHHWDMREKEYWPGGLFDGAYLLDVIEHVPVEDEEKFMRNVVGSVKDGGLIIVGTPNRAASAYASPQAQSGHVNLKWEPELRKMMEEHCSTVLIFSMNDEVIHTGFYPMAHYLLAVGVKR